MNWLEELGRDNRGSRPRCVLLTDGSREQVAERLTRIVGRPEILVSPGDQWQPQGKSDVREAQLDKRLDSGAALLPERDRRRLKKWWLAVEARTPSWDIASTCTISGERGLLLVEAKAHANELQEQDECRAEGANRKQIESALAEANAGLRKLTGGPWQLSIESHYQLSNRFAWSWKLAALRVPVVLVYLGFLKAQDMRHDGDLFQCANDWRDRLKRYCSGVVDETCWDKTLDVERIPLVPLIRVDAQGSSVDTTVSITA